MSAQRTLLVVATGILVVSSVCLLLYLCRARSRYYYLLLPPITCVYGYALAWAYGVSNSAMAIVLVVMGALFGVQGAWVLTTRIPRA